MKLIVASGHPNEAATDKTENGGIEAKNSGYPYALALPTDTHCCLGKPNNCALE